MQAVYAFALPLLLAYTFETVLPLMLEGENCGLDLWVFISIIVVGSMLDIQVWIASDCLRLPLIASDCL